MKTYLYILTLLTALLLAPLAALHADRTLPEVPMEKIVREISNE